jgi:long-subunit fatty acid transport protein
MNFGKTTFQSRWFYRQFFVNNGENAVELRTLNGEASLNDQEIISELSNGDTVLYKIRANYAASFFSIPVGLTYHFNKQKISPFIRYGISLDFHSKSAISLDIQKNGAFKTTDLNFQNNSIRIALQQMVSFGFEYKFSNNWSSFLESRLALPVSKINLSTDYKLKSSYITLGVGVKYALPCNIQKLKK